MPPVPVPVPAVPVPAVPVVPPAGVAAVTSPAEEGEAVWLVLQAVIAIARPVAPATNFHARAVMMLSYVLLGRGRPRRCRGCGWRGRGRRGGRRRGAVGLCAAADRAIGGELLLHGLVQFWRCR